MKTGAQPEQAAGHSSADGGKTKHGRRLGDLIFGFLIYGFLGVLFVWNNQTAREFVINNRYIFAIGLTMAVAALVFAWVKQDVVNASIKKQVAIILFIVMPVLLLLVGAVVFFPLQVQIIILRIVFLAIACLLPAVMYYLFIASRKSSLLQEFFTNLARLGLFDHQSYLGPDGEVEESELERRMRVLSYVQKFEAVYGPIPEEMTENLLHITTKNNVKVEHKMARYTSDVGGYFSPETAIPVVVASLLIGLGWLLTLTPWDLSAIDTAAGEDLRLSLVLHVQSVPVHFAFLGAYFFSLQSLFRRYVQKDLRASAYIAVVMRILLAILGTWVVLEIAEGLPTQWNISTADGAGLVVVSFVVGAFPPVAWQVITSAFRTITGARYFVPSLRSVMPVSDLDGLTVWHQARLEEEDIENVPNMASVDMVDLLLNTKIPADRVVDWVDQAILYTQLGCEDNKVRSGDDRGDAPGTRDLLRRHGIRTASSLILAYKQALVRDDLDSFLKMLPSSARPRLLAIVDTLGNNPNLSLIQRWKQWVISSRFVRSA